MADCNETLRELDAFLDRELSEETHVAIRAHLEGCPDCFQAFDFHAELKVVVSQKSRTDEMPAGLLAKLQQCFGDPDQLAEPDGRVVPDDSYAATDELNAGPDGA
jgi:anti-sigma factor (TIGR02949 family)